MPKEYTVLRFDENCGRMYKDCYATVTLEVLEVNQSSTITVKYPIQDDKHLMLLMTHAASGKDVSHPDKYPIAAAIKAALGLEIK